MTGFPPDPIRRPRPRARALLSGLALALLVAGCAEEEVILPGAREDIRPDAVTLDRPLAEIEGSRPIALPQVARNAAWPQAHGTPALRTDHPALSAAPQLLWTAPIGQGDSRRQRITADPVVAADRVFTLDADALVTATSVSGQTLWQRNLRPPRDSEGDATGGGLAYDAGRLYVSLGYGELVALDAGTGAELWSQEVDATASGAPTVSGGLVYLVAGDDTGWAIEADTGRLAWQVPAAPSLANVLGAPAPALDGDLAVFGFGSGELIATFRQGGLRRWEADVAGQRLGVAAARIGDMTGAPVIAGGRVFAGNHSGRMAAFDAASGERLWTAPEGAFGPVWPAGDSVFAVTDRNQLIRVDAGTGAIVWAVDLPGYVKQRPKRRAEIFAHHGPVLAGGRLVVASSDGLLRSFSPSNGALIGATELPGGATTAPVVAGGTLYVVNTDGQLLAFR